MLIPSGFDQIFSFFPQNSQAAEETKEEQYTPTYSQAIQSQTLTNSLVAFAEAISKTPIDADTQLSEEIANIDKATSQLECAKDVLYALESQESEENILSLIKSEITKTGAVLIPVLGKGSDALFIHIAREGVFLFNASGKPTHHPKLIEKEIDKVTKDPRIKTKTQQVLFLRSPHSETLENKSFFAALVTILRESRKQELPEIAENFVYNVLPNTLRSSWETPTDSSFHYKKDSASISSDKIVEQLFYHLLLDASQDKIKTKNLYKVLKLQIQNNLPLIHPKNFCKKAIKQKESLSQESLGEYIEKTNKTLEKNLFTPYTPTLKKRGILHLDLNPTLPGPKDSITSKIGIFQAPGQPSPSYFYSLQGSSLEKVPENAFSLPVNIVKDFCDMLDYLDRKTNNIRNFNFEIINGIANYIVKLPSFSSPYWEKIPLEVLPDLFHVLMNLCALLSTNFACNRHFNSALLKWTLYAIGEKLALKHLPQDTFKDYVISRKNLIPFLSEPKNFTTNPLLVPKYRELKKELLKEGFPTDGTLFTFGRHMKTSPSTEVLFFSQYLPPKKRNKEDEINSIMEESLQYEGTRIPLPLKLLQYLNIAIHNPTILASLKHSRSQVLWIAQWKSVWGRLETQGFRIHFNNSIVTEDYLSQNTSPFYSISYFKESQKSFDLLERGKTSETANTGYFINQVLLHASPPKESSLPIDSIPTPQLVQYYVTNPDLKEKLRMFTDPKDGINRFIGYFLEHSINKYPNWTYLAYSTFFRIEMLSEQLEDSPEFVSLINRFITLGIEQCQKENPENNKALEVLTLGLAIKYHLYLANSPLFDELLDFRSLIKNTLLVQDCTHNKKSELFALQFIAEAIENPDELAVCSFLAGSIPLSKWEDQPNREILESLFVLKKEKELQIKNFLSKTTKQELVAILNETVALFEIDSARLEWIYLAKLHKYISMYGTFEIANTGFSLSPPQNDPKVLLNSLLKKGTIGKALNIHDCSLGEQTSDSTFELISDSYVGSLYARWQLGRFQIKTLKNGTTYTLLPVAEFSSFKDLAKVKEKYPTIEKEASRIWASEDHLLIERNEEEDTIISIDEALDLEPSISVPLGSKTLEFRLLNEKAYSKEDPEFFLTMDQFPEILFPHLILESETGERKVQILGIMEKFYSFKILSTGQLSPGGLPSTLFYIFMLSTTNKNEANKLIEKTANSLTKRFSESEKELIQAIAMASTEPLIGLKTFTLLLEELLKFPPLGEEAVFHERVMDLVPLFALFTPIYLKCLNEEGHLDKKHLMLSKNQEIIFLHFLTKIIPEPLIISLIEHFNEELKKLGKQPVSEPMKNSLKDLALNVLKGLHPLGSIEINQKTIIPEFLLCFPILKDRLDSLENGSLLMNNYHPKPFSVTIGPLGKGDLITHLNDYREEISQKKTIKKMLQDAYSSDWVRSNDLFLGPLSIEKNFAAYYEIIQEASLEELAQIKTIFEVSLSLEKDPLPEAKTLELLLKSPKSYRTMKDLCSILKSYEEWTTFAENTKARYKSFHVDSLGVIGFFPSLAFSFYLKSLYKFAEARAFVLQTSLHPFGLMQTISSVALASMRLVRALFQENITIYFNKKVVPIETKPFRGDTLLSIDTSRLEKEDQELNAHLKKLEKTYTSIFSLDQIEALSLEGSIEDPLEKKRLKDYMSLLNQNSYQPKGNLQELLGALKTRVHQEENDIAYLEEKIVKMLSPSFVHKSIEEITQEITKQELHLESILLLFLKGSKESFQESFTLSEEEISSFFNKIALYLTKKTNLTRVVTIEKNLERYLAGDPSDPIEQKALFDLFMVSLQKKREYPLTIENRSKLLFEACQGISLRKGQVEKVSLISETLLKASKQVLFELSTGAGKTHAILPCSNIETADGERLTINIFPQAIAQENIESNKMELEKLGIHIDTLEFQRTTFMSKETIEYLYRQLLSDVEKRKPLNCNAESLQSLKLHFLSLFADGISQKSIHPKNEELAEMLRKILHLIKTKGSANIDEARSTLDPFSQLIYTRKEKVALPSEEINLFEKMFSILFEDKQFADILIANKQHEKISSEEYKALIQRGLAGHMEALLEIPLEHSIAFREYVVGNAHHMDEFLKKHPKKESIDLIRGLLVIILPEALSGQVNQKYGFSKKHRNEKKFVIPFLSSNEPKETNVAPSEYQNRHETATKTLIALFHEGLSCDQVNELLDNLKQLYLKELSLGVPAFQSLALKTFRRVFEVDESIAPNCLLEGFVEDQQQKIKHKPAAVLEYFKTHIASGITTYKETLTSTTADFLKQFSSSSSMTATPQHPKAHGKVTAFEETFGSKGFIPYHYFSNGKAIHQINTESFATLIESCSSLILKENHNALIDVGGLFRGHKNNKVAEKLWKILQTQRPNLEEIVYFDEEAKEFMAMNKVGGKTRLINSKTAPSNRFTFFDMARTVGSDIKQGATASALVLFESDSIQTDMGQGIGRMRELQYGQTLCYALPKSLHTKLFGTTPLSLNEKTKILYDYLLEQEKDNAGHFNLAAIKQQIDADIHDLILNAIYSAPSLKAALEIFKKDSKELVKETCMSPSDLYGSIVVGVHTTEELDRYLKLAQHRIQKLHCLSKQEKIKECAALLEYEALWKGETAIPLPEKTISTKQDIHGERDVLVDVEIQVENEIHAEKPAPPLDPRTISKWSDKIHLFEKGWDKVEAIQKTSWNILPKLPTLKTIGNTIDDFERKSPIKAILLKSMILSSAYFVISMTTIFLVATSWKVKLAVSGIFFFMNKNKIKNQAQALFSKAPPLFKVRDLAEKEFGKTVADSLFDLELLVTNNFSNQKPIDLLESPQELFTSEQKPAFQMLFVLDEDTNKQQAILVDQNDTRALRRIFAKDRTTEEETAALRKRKVVLYDLYTETIIAQGKNAITKEMLKQTPRFHEYTALAKIWDQRSSFKEEELRILKQKTEQVTKPVMQNIFKKIFKEASQKTLQKFQIGEFGQYLYAH